MCAMFAASTQAAKLQSLYSQTESQVAESEAKVAELSAQLVAAQDQAEVLRRELRNMQVRTGASIC